MRRLEIELHDEIAELLEENAAAIGVTAEALGEALISQAVCRGTRRPDLEWTVLISNPDALKPAEADDPTED